MAHWLKRLPEDARSTYILLAEWLRYICGYSAIDTNPASGWLLGAGTDAQLSDSNPQLITVSAVLPFVGGHVGKYIMLYDATNERNMGVFKIVAVPATNKVLVGGGVYGANFTTELNVKWRLIDQAALAAAVAVQQCVFEAPIGAGSTPAWQVLLELPVAPAQSIDISVQPFGAWNNVGHVPFLGLTAYSHVSDTTEKWYFTAEATMLAGWTENNAGNDVSSVFYAGSISPFVPSSDPSPVVQWGGVSVTDFLTQGEHVGADNTTVVASKQVRLLDPVSVDDLFTALPNDPLDLRNLGLGVLVGSDDPGFEEIRGVLRNFVQLSDNLSYKSFAANNRRVLCLGDGLGIVWNGELVV
jgi:hypothetical protein